NCKAKSIEKEPKVVRKNDDAPIIKEWLPDNEERDVSQTKIKKKTVRPSIAKIEFVKSKQQKKTARKIVKQVEQHRQNTHSPRGNQRNWNNMMSQKLESNFEMYNKACYVCRSFDHLHVDCNYYQKQFQNQKMVKLVWNNAHRVNHKNFAKKTHPCAKKNMVLRAVLMKSGLVSINTAQLKIIVNVAKSMSYLSKIAHLTVKRPIYKNTIFKNSNVNQRVNTVRGKKFNTAKPKAVVNAVNGNNFNGNPQTDLQDQEVIDSRCSRHMTWNMSYLIDYEEIDEGYVAFGGNPKGGKIKSKARTPQQNRVAERRNRTLIEAVRTMLADSKLPTTFWTNAVNTTDEGFFVRYSLNSKAFRVFTNRTRIMEENMHIRFSQSTPNVIGSGPDWLFDIDALTRIMNYEPIAAGTQSDGFVGTKASDNAGQARMETEPVEDYILLPLWTADLPFSQDLNISHNDGSKPSCDDGKKFDEDPKKESECKDQEKEDNVNNTNNVNTAGNVNTVSSIVNVVGTNDDNELPFDPSMPALEDVSIFNFSSDDENDGTVADINNLNTTNQVSHILTIRNHKDHPLDQVIRDLQLATQTRKMSKNLEERGFEDDIFISQDKNAAEILKKFRFTEVKTASTHMETQKPLLKDEDGEDVDVHMYRYQVNLKVLHLHVVKRIVRFVRAATTASSLEAEQDSGNITKTQSKARPNESSSQGTNSGGGPRCQETIGDTTAQTRVLDLEQTKTTQNNDIDSLKMMVKKLEKRNRIQEMFDRAVRRVNTFEDFKTELVEGKENRVGEELIQENEEEVAIDAILLVVKSPRIVDQKIHKEGKKSYYQIKMKSRRGNKDTKCWNGSFFIMSLTGAASHWLRNKPTGSIKTWETLKEKFLSKYCPPVQIAKKMEEINNFQQDSDETLYQAWERFKELLLRYPQHYLIDMQEVILFYKGLDVPTRQILDSKGAISSMKAADAKKAIQDMANHSQKWHNGMSIRCRSAKTSNGLAAIQAQLNNLRREIKKVNKIVYAAQVGCELCKGPHYTKDCPLKEEGKTLEEAYYTQFGVPFQQGGQYLAAALRFYQRNNGNIHIKSEDKKWKNH
nr:hypothetical protein [Tanacetum cinerariifolium]